MANKKCKVTIAELARKYKVSRQTLYTWKADGVNIYDNKAVKDYAENRNKKQVDTSEEKLLQSNTGLTIYEQIDRAESYQEARYLKMKLEAKTQAHKLDVEQGLYTKNSEIKENLIRIASAVKSSLLRYEYDLPPITEGLPASKIQKIIREKNNIILSMMYEMSEELYK